MKRKLTPRRTVALGVPAHEILEKLCNNGSKETKGKRIVSKTTMLNTIMEVIAKSPSIRKMLMLKIKEEYERY